MLFVPELVFHFYFRVYSGHMLGAWSRWCPAHVRTTAYSLAFALAAGPVRHLPAVLRLADRPYRQPARRHTADCAAASGFIATLAIYRAGKTMRYARGPA